MSSATSAPQLAGAGQDDHPESVSVVINAYNEPDGFLAEAIESALSQRLAPFEIIVVEDGPLIDHGPVFSRYPSIRVIRRPNGGLAASRNTGLRAACGKYIAFLDGDDRLLPNALASNIARFADHPGCGFVFAGYRFIDRAGRPMYQGVQKPISEDAYASFLEANCIGMHATVLYRRDRLLEIGGFDERFKACEDYDVYLRLAQRYPVSGGGEIVAEYRRHDGNMSNDNVMMLDSSLRVLAGQKEAASAKPVWQQAYNRGVRGWKDYYAGQELLKAHDGLTRKGFRAVPYSGLIRTFLRAPQAMSAIAMREIFDRFRRRLSIGRINLGDLRRTAPISTQFGYDRGTPVDRRYIEDFLSRNDKDIRGRVLEIGDNAYTVRFGGDRVTRSDVLHVDPDVPGVTIVADLGEGKGLPENAFDCIVCTQTIHLIFDMQKAVANLERMLKPGGILLLTVPGVSSIDHGEWGANWYWSLTPAALKELVISKFGEGNTEITSYGNVLAAVAFLYGLAQHELLAHEMDAVDPHYPVIVTARAVKHVR